MRRLVYIALAGVVAWLFMTNRLSLGMLDPRAVGTDSEGPTIVRQSDEIEARFVRLSEFDDTVMIVGSVALPLRNALQHARLRALPIRDARQLALHVSDFHLASADAGDQTKERSEFIDFVANDRIARAALDDASAASVRAIRSGGARPCLHVRGANIGLEKIEVQGMKQGLETTAARAHAQSRFVLVEEARLVRCEAMLYPTTVEASR